MTYELDERFWSKVDKRGNCWRWTAGTDKKGYGKYWIDGGMRLAHRVSYQAHFGVVLAPEDIVLHTCDNPPCVNPSHHKIGTVLENNEDKLQKGRQSRGTQITCAKFTETDIKDIRAWHQHDGFPITFMAKELGVAHSTISDIVNYKTWTHV